MDDALHRHDINDRSREIIAPHLPGKPNDRGGTARDNRQFINAVIWIPRTGAPWRDLPPEYGDWKNTHRRFSRWRDKGIWEKLLGVVMDDPDFEWLMINDAIGRTKGGSTQRFTWPWMRLVCRCESLSRRVSWRIARLLRN